MTKLFAVVLGAALSIACAAPGALGQEAQPKRPGGAIGDLVSVDTARGVLTIKTTAWAETRAAVTAATQYLLIEPGKKDLNGAVAVTLADVKVGDRVWARGEPGADGAIAARQIVVMSAVAIADRNQRDSQDWQRRGVMGEVRAVDAATGEVTVESYRGEPIVVAVGTGTTLRRLESGATDLTSAEPIALADIHPGNQIAARGERSADGARLTAETIVAGTFPRPMRGRVDAVDTANNEVRISTREGRSIALALGADSAVRKLTPAPAGTGGPGAGGPGAGGPSPNAAGGPGAPGAPERRGPRGFAFALGDRTELDRRTTGIALADVKPGDFVFAIVEPGATDTSARVKVLVKFELPAGQERGPRNSSGPSMNDPGLGDLPF